MRRVVDAADVASRCSLVVDSIDDQAAAFYHGHGFEPVVDNPLRLVVRGRHSAQGKALELQPSGRRPA